MSNELPECKLCKGEACIYCQHMKRRIREVIGCTYAVMCTYAMAGKDITEIEFPEIADIVTKTLELEIENV